MGPRDLRVSTICNGVGASIEGVHALAGLESILDRHLAVVAADRHHHNGDIVRVVPNRTKRVPSDHVERGRAAGRLCPFTQDRIQISSSARARVHVKTCRAIGREHSRAFSGKTKVLYRGLLAIRDTVMAEAATDQGACRFACGCQTCSDHNPCNQVARFEIHGFTPPGNQFSAIFWD